MIRKLFSGKTPVRGRVVRNAALVAVAWASLLASQAPLGPSPARALASAGAAVEVETKDVLVFRNGNTLEGKILSETATQVTFRGTSHGISFEATYELADILTIQRDVEAEGSGTPERGEVRRPSPTETASRDRRVSGEGGPVVYHAPLRGVFSRDIALQSMERLVRDAAKHAPDYLIFTLENDWNASMAGRLAEEELLEVDLGPQYDNLFLVERMAPLLTELMDTEWERRPKVIFFVRRAMGGAAFLPFLGESIYFHPEARMGGIGYLDWFEMGGDSMVDEKQISLRMGHAEGLAIKAGYDPRIMRAMMVAGYALSYSYEDGRVVLKDGTSGQVQLTRAIAKGERQDTVDDFIRGTSRDILTLNAEIAKVLGISKGTVTDLDGLLFELGIHRNHTLIDGDGDRILDRWSRSVREAERNYVRLARDLNEVRVEGATRRERNRGRGQQIRILESMRSILMQYDGALPWWRLPGGSSIEAINARIQEIRFQMQTDQ
ncbi:MAG: hypothetical protein EA378_06030 [Phycisphaerales bacterium]|nr:MAG: hypothetical protein EA378_06030 [Phycisphaerales bacterium]